MAVKKTKQPFRLEQFLEIRTTFDLSFAPDDQQICFISNFSGCHNIWRVPITGGWPHQITVDGAFKHGLAWTPTGILFSQDNQGDENHQIKLIAPQGGLAADLTKAPKVQHFLGAISRDKQWIAYSHNARDPRCFDTFVRKLGSSRPRRVLQREQGGIDVPVAFSPDRRFLLVLRDYHNLDQDVLLVDLKTGKHRNLTAHKEDTVYSLALWDPEGQGIYVITDRERDFKNIGYIDLQTEDFSWVTDLEQEVHSMAISPDGKYLAYTYKKNGNIMPRLFYRRRMREIPVSWPKGLYTRLTFGNRSRKLAYYYSGPTCPADLWVMDLASRKRTQLTYSFIGGIRSQDLVSPRAITYKSFDGLKIHALLYLPRNARKNRRLPAILWPHGGPHHQNYNTFSAFFQSLVARGYVLIAPDFRGSTGYGKRFQRMINVDWGGGDFQDLLKAVEYLKNTGYVNPKKIGVVGMSYGGFATLTCLTRAPEVFAAGAEAFGPSNLETFIRNNPPSWLEAIYDFVGHPERDKEYIKQRSPINYVNQVKAPLLVIQGANDPRVVQSESEQIVKALRRRKVPVEYILFKDEGHGFMKKANRFKAYQSIIEFMDRHLK